MDLAAALTDAEQALAELLKTRSELDGAIEDRQAEIYGLQLALSRHRPEDENEIIFPVDLGPEASGKYWRGLARVDAIDKVLTTMETPMGPTEISEYLGGMGRNDTPNDVSAALAYLKRIGRVVRVGRARWTTPQQELREVANAS